jgi:NAD-dependent SIR2 family protein deacetylase
MPLIEATPGEEKHLQDIADTIASSHKVLIVTGAGISTSIGIPVR